MKNLFGKVFWYAHWQNLDEVYKQELAEKALTDALRSMGVLTNDRWKDIDSARTAFRKKLQGKLGHGWRNGRAWMHVYVGHPDKGKKLPTVGVQWTIFKKHHSVGISLVCGSGDSDRDIDFSIRIPGFGLYLSLEGILPFQFFNPGSKYPSSRMLSVAWHSESLWFCLWADPDETDYRVPFWHPCSKNRTPVIHPLDILFGKLEFSSEKLDEQPGEVVLPEGTYPVQVVLEKRTWQRPRLPWKKKTRISTEVISAHGLPIPGKGENGWDCGEDAYYSVGTSETTLEGAVRVAAEKVLETRRSRGGEGWQPQEKA